MPRNEFNKRGARLVHSKLQNITEEIKEDLSNWKDICVKDRKI